MFIRAWLFCSNISFFVRLLVFFIRLIVWADSLDLTFWFFSLNLVLSIWFLFSRSFYNVWIGMEGRCYLLMSVKSLINGWWKLGGDAKICQESEVLERGCSGWKGVLSCRSALCSRRAPRLIGGTLVGTVYYSGSLQLWAGGLRVWTWGWHRQGRRVQRDVVLIMDDFVCRNLFSRIQINA